MLEKPLEKEIKSSASLEATSTAEIEWLYVTPHSHSPTHYRDVILYVVFPISVDRWMQF